MNDKELQLLLPDYLGGRLDKATCGEIERRLDVSAELREALEAAKLYCDAVSAIEPVRAPDNFLDKVHRRIESGNGLLDRLFRPFHIKLPIELAGVAVTVMLVVLLYNPFSGKLPQQAGVEQRDSRQFNELQEPSAALETAPVAEIQPVPPVAMERPAPAVIKKKALRQSPAGNAMPADGSGEIRKETPSAYVSSATGMAAKSAPRAKASTLMTDKPAYVEPPSASPSPALLPEDEYADRIAGAPASVASPAPLARSRSASTVVKDASPELAAGAPAAEYKSSAADAASELEKETLRYSSNVRDEERTAPARKMARPAMTVREAAPVSSQGNVPDSSDETAIKKITDLVNRYRGTIETIPVHVERTGVIRLKLTSPSKKFGAFKKILSTDIKVASITDTISASGRSDLTIILEVYPR